MTPDFSTAKSALHFAQVDLPPVLCRRPAMNTWFEIVLLGEDRENLEAAAEAVLDEIDRIEKLLSRFDPASEVSRVNREAANQPVLVDYELAQVLETCRQGWAQTDGFFDVTARRNFGEGTRLACERVRLERAVPNWPGEPPSHAREPRALPEIQFDLDTRRIAFRNENVRLDFGGFGKGYALDCAAHLLREYGVTQALLHGGTSSVLAIGNGFDGNGWLIGLKHFGPADSQIRLSDQALSTSATGSGVSDILDPHSGEPISFQTACTVIAESAAQAEIFSTALLCMGKERARSLASNVKPSLRVLWSDADCSTPICL